MNKTLFCALCCVGISGFSSAMGAAESLCENVVRDVTRTSSDRRVMEMFENVSLSLEEVCRYFEPCVRTKEALVSLFQSLVPLYERRIKQNLCDKTSDSGKAVLSQLDGDINDLEQNVKDLLDSYAKETHLKDDLHPEFYFDCCDYLKRAMNLFCRDELNDPNS